MEIVVVSAAPITSLPRGRSTNINKGSSTIFKTAPKVIPILEIRDCPVERIKCASADARMVGIPPMIMVIQV